jgi:hypothetical protein
MSSFPCLVRFVSGSGQVRYRLGDRLVDRYLEFVAGRCRPNTLRAVAFDLKAFFTVIREDPEVIRPAGRLVSTIFAADEGWFAQRQITAHNHASSANPLISPQGLVTVAQMLADGTITARIRSVADLDAAGQILDELRHGGLRGKAVIRL